MLRTLQGSILRHSSRVRFCSGISALSDQEIVQKVIKGEVKFYSLETLLAPDFERAVSIRREVVCSYIQDDERKTKFQTLPYKGYAYDEVMGRNCENVVGYTTIPVGVAGPLKMDGDLYPVPLATTEGALVASIHRGTRVISDSGGVTTEIMGDGMTRAPVVRLPDIHYAVRLKKFCEGEGYQQIATTFNNTSRFARLQSLQVVVAGRNAFLRFKSTTGDAMGMNMVTKGTVAALAFLQKEFEHMQLVSISGNFCCDKKPSAINWIQGRGKSVIAQAVLEKHHLKSFLKVDASHLQQLNVDKNLVGSAIAGSVGGFNAHAANVVAAMFIACGQDPAQVVASSNCMTTLEAMPNGDLFVSCTMPSIEVGTVGGGTHLHAQSAVLNLIGVAGAHPEDPGQNARVLARLICATVMAGELSLMSDLSRNKLMDTHLSLNRKSTEPESQK